MMTTCGLRKHEKSSSQLNTLPIAGSERTPIDPGTEYGLPILPPLLKLVHSSLG
jgi:hypothetical protein